MDELPDDFFEPTVNDLQVMMRDVKAQKYVSFIWVMELTKHRSQEGELLTAALREQRRLQKVINHLLPLFSHQYRSSSTAKP